MHLLITMVLVGTANLVVCDPEDDPVYSEFCGPPNGTFTKPPVGSTLAPYYGLLPIERCCPACEECINVGGHCKLRWVVEIYPEFCDFTTIPYCRDYSCTCCVKCSDDKCSDCTQTGGECRVECRTDEIEDKNNKCSYSPDDYLGEGGCKCCKKCEATSECTDALGICVTDPADCPSGTFPSTGCCGGCYCCKPVLEPVVDGNGVSSCSEDGAYCTETDDCATGFYSCFGLCEATQHVNGLVQKVVGYCCVPKSSRRRSINTFVKQMIGNDAGPPKGYGRNLDQF